MKNALIILLTLISTACAWQPSNIDFTPLSDKVYNSKGPNADIKIFRSKIPTRPFEELGIVIANSGGVITFLGATGNSYQKAINLLKEEARRKGGDAVIDLREGTASGSNFVTLTGSVIRWH